MAQLTEAVRSNTRNVSNNHWQPNGLTSYPCYSFPADINCSDRRRDFYKIRSSLNEISLRSAKKIYVHHNSTHSCGVLLIGSL